VTEDRGDPVVRELQQRTGGIVVSETARHDFNFIRSFDNIINGNGTFSLWASYFGNPKKCYFFKPWMRWGKIDLENFTDAILVDGSFTRNAAQESKNWDGYWLR
jgi:hypothetical protein